MCSSRSRNCRGIELSSRDFKTVAISVTRAKLYCINTWYARADRETVEVSNYRAGTSKLSQYRSLEQSYTVLHTCTSMLLEQIRETVEVSNYRAGTSKLSQYRSLEAKNCISVLSRDLKTVVSVYSSRDLKTVSSISSRDLKTVEHRTIEQGWKRNCRALHIEQGLENCRGIELSSRDLKTVAISVTRALSNVAGKVIICDNNISASGGGMA